MYDYPTFQGTFEQQRGPSFTNPSQTQNQWSATQRGPPPNPVKLPRELTDELAQRFTMRQKERECKTGPSIDVIKRKFEVENAKPKSKSNLPKNPSSIVSFKKSSHVINNSLEESYWAQWKPTSSSFATNVVKEESFGKGRTHFTVNSVTNRCNVDSLTLCEGKKLMEEKSLKVIRKPMVIVESNSSEGDKHIQGKLFLCNPCDNPVNQNNSQCYQNYQQPYPTFTASMPNYHSIFYYGPSDHNYHERVKPCKRKESNNRCVKPRNKDNYQNDKQVSQKDEYKKRPKSGVEKKEEKLKKNKSSKSNEEICKTRVRFCTKYRDEDSESCCSRRDSTRTIEGYHGDVDTESQVDTRKYDCDDEDEDEDTQEFHDNDYSCYCHCCNKNYWMDDYNYSQSDNMSENSYLYNYNCQVYRYQEEPQYPNYHKNESNSSFYYNQFKDSTYSSTSRMTSSNPQIKKRIKESSTQSPASRIACACNTEPKTCSNKACETMESTIKEKKVGDDTMGGLKVIKEKSEMIMVSSSSRSDEYERRIDRNDGCKCCSDAPCRQSSTGTTTSSIHPCKSSSPSSKDTLAVAVGSSRDNMQDEGSFDLDDPINRGKETMIQRGKEKKRCSHHCVSSGTSTEPVSNESNVVDSRIGSPRDYYKEKAQHERSQYEKSRYEKSQYDKSQYDKSQYEKSQYDKSQYDKSQYDKSQYDKSHYDKSQYDKAQYDKAQYDKEQYDKAQYDKTQYDKPQYDKSQYDKSHYDKSQYDKPQYDKAQYDKAQYDKSQYDKRQDEKSQYEKHLNDDESKIAPKVTESDNFTKGKTSAGATLYKTEKSQTNSRPTSATQSRTNESIKPELINVKLGVDNSKSGSVQVGDVTKKNVPVGTEIEKDFQENTKSNSRDNSKSPRSEAIQTNSRPGSGAQSRINSRGSPPSSIRGRSPNPNQNHPEINSDFTQTAHPNVQNKLESAYTVMNQRNYVTNSTPFNPERTQSIKIDSSQMINSGITEIIYTQDLNSPRSIPKQNSYTEPINPENQNYNYPITMEGSNPNLRHSRNNDVHQFNPHEKQIVYCVDTNRQDPKILSDDRNCRESYGVFPSESKNTTTAKTLILQRNSRYMSLKGHTYTLKPPSNSCSRSWRSPKRKR